ncbi:MAG: hypothetical protein JW860_09250, partial [Sedimentisphaerales bacterium]|nr:hypothetical protein [Sedimentisphaerales bacterium]
MSIRLILMSKEGQARQQYEEALRRQQVEFDTVGTLAELTDMLKQKAYNGILIDVLSKVKESSEEQTRVHHILDMYPLARLK